MEDLLHNTLAKKLTELLTYTNTYSFFNNNDVYMISLYIVIILTIYYLIWFILYYTTSVLDNPNLSFMKHLDTFFNVVILMIYNVLTVVIFISGLIKITDALHANANACKAK